MLRVEPVEPGGLLVAAGDGVARPPRRARGSASSDEREPLPPRRAARGRTRGSSRASRTGRRRGAPGSLCAAPREPPRPRRPPRAQRRQPSRPTKTLSAANTSPSRASSRSTLQAIAARSVRCRSGTSRGPFARRRAAAASPASPAARARPHGQRPARARAAGSRAGGTARRPPRAGTCASAARARAHEQRHGLVLERERRARRTVLAVEPQRGRLVTSTRTPGCGQELADERRRVLDVLEVVEHEQRRRSRRWSRSVSARGRPASSATSERARDASATSASSRTGGEVDEPDAVGEGARQLPRRRERDARLARAARPGQRHEPRRAGQELDHLRDLAPAPDERGRRRREAAPGPELLVLHRAAPRPAAGSRPGARAARRPARSPARRRASRAPRDRPPARRPGDRSGSSASMSWRAQTLAQRVSGDWRSSAGSTAACRPSSRLGLEAVLDRGCAQLLEPVDLGLRPLRVGEVRERRAAPELERGVEPLARAVRVARRAHALRLRDESLEAVRVDRLRLGLEHVAPGAARDRAAELAPQA